MMKINFQLKALLLLKLSFMVSLVSVGQSYEAGALQAQFKEYADKTLQEKLFVHTDKPAYLAGETMWFKVYSIDGNEHTLLDVSKVVYLEILDKESVPVLQTKVSMAEGSGNGSLILPSSVNSGHYTVRAYTNWMKNFSSAYFFEKPLTIVNTFKTLGLEATSQDAKHDLQFFPEGGSLVNNLKSKVAFKATDKNGKSVSLKGAILNQNNDTVAHVTSHKFGMGHFFITPVAGGQYRAVLKDGKGATTTQYLPAAQTSGIVMHLGYENADFLNVTVSTNEAVGSLSAPTVYLLVHTRNDVKVLEEGRIGGDGKVRFPIEKNKLGDGVSHFTIFNSVRQPLAERLYFKKPSADKVLEIKANASQKQVAQRAQIELDFSTQNKAGQAEATDMSVAVFRIDSLSKAQQQDFASFLWLTSDLRGTIESPAYYLGNGAEVDAAIDNLMLTHGWRRFAWDKVLGKEKTAFAYVPEFKGHFVQGKVLDAATGEPARNIEAYLASPSQTVNLYAAKSDREGNILFDVQNFYGSRDLIVQADSRAMNTYRFQIESPFSAQASGLRLPAFNLSRSMEKELEAGSIHLQVQNYHLPSSFYQGLIPAHNNEAFYGTPDRTFMLDDYTRFPVMEEVMREYVQPVMVRKRGGKFNFMVIDIPRKAPFEGNPLVLLDGVPVFDIDKIMAYDPRKVKKLDVVSRRYYLGPLTFNGIVSYTTYDGDMKDFVLDEKVLLTEYEGVQLKREFYSPKYTSAEQTASAVPDLRTVLNWTPSLKTGKDGKQQLSFFSSDQSGKYMVVVYGISETGSVGNATYTFDVVDQVL